MGRLFTEDDAGSPATTATAILSHAFWQQRFKGAADAVGRAIQLDERSYTIVGVMPADFAFPDRETQVWMPQRIQPVLSDGGKRLSVSIFSVLARMRPGVTPEQVAAEATSRARAGADLGPAGLALFGTRAAPTIVAVPALDVLTAEVRPALGILLVAVLLLLTTAVGSIAILQLARAARRRREMTVRTALGARTIHLTRQWLSESALVGIAGGLAGVAGAAVILRLLPAVLPPDFPRMADVSLDWRAAASAAAATLLASLISALVPTLQSRRVDLAHSLAEDSIATVGGAKAFKRHANPCGDHGGANRGRLSAHGWCRAARPKPDCTHQRRSRLRPTQSVDRSIAASPSGDIRAGGANARGAAGAPSRSPGRI